MTLARTFLVALVLLTAPSADAYEHKMQQGGNAFIFDYPYNSSSISVYIIDKDEPYSDMMEGMMHDWFIMEDIGNAIGGLPAGLALSMGRASSIQNAFAVIRQPSQERLIVIDPGWLQGHSERVFVIAHELGHHVCGHTAGLMRDRPWDRELEADRFAGFVIKAMEEKGTTNFRDAVGSAMEYLSKFPSVSHPPRDMRIQAALEGYRTGSSCMKRNIETSDAPTGPIEGTPWNHNGSEMKLLAEGARRKFVYVHPRQGLAAAGVSEGQPAFEGAKNGNSYSGTAFVFSSKCGRIGFEVSGTVAADQRSVTLYGKAPRRSPANCNIVDYSNETLVFMFSGQ